MNKIQTREKARTILIQRQNQKIKRMSNTIQILRAKIRGMRKEQKMKLENVEIKSTQCNFLVQTVEKFKRNIYELEMLTDENNNDTVSDDDENLTDSSNKLYKTRECTQGRPFKAELRQLYYFMRSCHIGVEHISPVIKKVLSLVGVHTDDLPAPSTVTNLASEMTILSRKHVLDVVEKEVNVTMYRDATTEKGCHYYAIKLSDGTKPLTAGIREVADMKSESLANCVNDILTDVAINSDTNILHKVKNVMTDRSATEEKINKILFAQMQVTTELENKLNSFKCAVHPLLQFQEVCEKERKKELSHFEKECSFAFSKDCRESYTHTLLRFTSKLFFKDSSGDPLNTKTYLQTAGIKNIPIENFRGNRFNTFFFNAAGTHYLAEHLVNYLRDCKTTTNYTQNFILQALQNDNILATCKALGIICKIITEPYWKIAADDSISPISMGNIYNRLVKVLLLCKDNRQLMLKNDISLVYGPQKPMDEVCINLFTPCNYDHFTELYISKFCTALKTKSAKLFADFLPDGHLFSPSEHLIKTSSTCSANNITLERLMACTDHALKRAPNMTTHNMESMVMYRNNNTDAWLDSNSTKKEELVKMAMQNKSQVIEQNKLRKSQLYDQRCKIIEQKRTLKKQQMEKKQKQKDIIQSLIKENGIWNNEMKIDEELNKVKTKKEKLILLKKQISVYKDKDIVQLAPSEKHLVAFSQKGKQHDVDKLKSNLIQLINKSNVTQPVDDSNIFDKPDLLIGKPIVHTWNDANNGQDAMWNGRIMSYGDGIFKVISLTVQIK